MAPSADENSLLKLADLVEEHQEELALYESMDVGKPISNALTADIGEGGPGLMMC